MFALPALITILNLMLLLFLALKVVRARQQYKVTAPAINGHPIFECYYRIQMNTIESTVIFLPALWLFSLYIDPYYAAVFGTIWLLSRLYYIHAYIRPHKNRRPAFGLSVLITGILLVNSLVMILSDIVKQFIHS